MGLRVLLAEIVGVRMTTLLDAYSDGASCLYPACEHDCQVDPVSDALAAWTVEPLEPGPAHPGPWWIGLAGRARKAHAVRDGFHRTSHPVEAAQAEPARVAPEEDPGEASPLAWSAADDDADPDTLEEILSLIDPLLWAAAVPRKASTRTRQRLTGTASGDWG